MPATTPGHCRRGLAIRTSSTRCVTPSWPPIGSRTFGGRRSVSSRAQPLRVPHPFRTIQVYPNEIRALRQLQREQGPSSHVFKTERDGPMTPKAFHALFGRIGERAKMPFPVHPHMLRHGCGYALANAGHDTRALQAWLGHKNIQHTVRYTELAPDRFKEFWR